MLANRLRDFANYIESKCPKCDGDDLSIKYTSSRTAKKWPDDLPDEILAVTCNCCGYLWPMRCKDSEVRLSEK
jgi:hypothetical protein